MSIIELENVAAAYGRRSVLGEIDLSIQAGEFVALVGGNGAGKSTLLDVMAGDHPAASGTVRLLGRPLLSFAPADLARHRAYLTQHTRLAFDFAVEDVVAFGHRLPDDSAVRSAMARAGVQEFRGRRVTELSGGERRRIHFARLLAQVLDGGQSELVLLDEPTAALDPKFAHRLLDTALDLTRRGSAVVVVLHDLNLAATYADRVVLLGGGRIVASGRPHEVLTTTHIQSVFDIRTHVLKHPDSGRPLVVRAGGAQSEIETETHTPEANHADLTHH